MNKLLLISRKEKTATVIQSIVKGFEVVYSDFEMLNVVYHLSQGSFHKIIVECDGPDDAIIFLTELLNINNSVSIIIIIPSLSAEEEQRLRSIQGVESILVKPCSKRAVLQAIETSSKEGRKVDCSIIVALIEAYGAKNSVLSRAYTRISGYIRKLKGHYEFDDDYLHSLLCYYLLAITTLDEELITDLLTGLHSRKESIGDLIEQIEKIDEYVRLHLDGVDSTPLQEMLYSQKKFDGKGYPRDDVAGQEIPLCSRLLRLFFDFHYLQEKGKSIGESIFILSRRDGWYDPAMVKALHNAFGEEATYYDREVFPLGLRADMVMAQDLYVTVKGQQVLLIKKGQTLSERNVEYITRHAQDILDVTEPILIKEAVWLEEKRHA